MNQRQVRYWERYINKLANIMGLRDWEIHAVTEPIGEGNIAQCNLVFGQRVAAIALSENFFNQPPQEQRSTITHELIHCHVEQIMRHQKTFEELFPKDLWLAFCWEQHESMEYAVDAIAVAWAQSLPLPENPPA